LDNQLRGKQSTLAQCKLQAEILRQSIIGDSATATGKDVVTIGNTKRSLFLGLSAGTGGLTLTNTSTAGTIFNTATATDDQLTLLPNAGGAARYTGTNHLKPT